MQAPSMFASELEVSKKEGLWLYSWVTKVQFQEKQVLFPRHHKFINLPLSLFSEPQPRAK